MTNCFQGIYIEKPVVGGLIIHLQSGHLLKNNFQYKNSLKCTFQGILMQKGEQTRKKLDDA